MFIKLFYATLLCGLFLSFTNKTLSQNRETYTVGSDPPTIDNKVGSLSAEKIAERFLPSVVLINCDDGDGNISQGSGFFIGPGIILTNAHVIEGMIRGTITTTLAEDNLPKKFRINQIVNIDYSDTDLAVLFVSDVKNRENPKIDFSPFVTIGETIYVLSNPLGLSGTISQGIIAGKTRKINNVELLQISAPISPGSSGGIVLNSNGKVVGVAVASLSKGQNLNFAIPSNQIVKFMDQSAEVVKKSDYTFWKNISDGWVFPRSAISMFETKTNPQISSISKNEPLPSFKETTNWITEKLVGINVYSGKMGRKIQDIKFTGCNMYLEEQTFHENGYSVKSSHFPDLKFLFSSKVSVNKFDTYGIWLSFSKNFVTTEKYFLLSQIIENSKSDSITILVNNEETAERVTKAFDRLKELCSQNIKEPF